MTIAIGATVAHAVGLLGRLTGMDRDRAAYPIILMVIASYYVLFALMSESSEAAIAEAAVATVCAAAAVLGYLFSLWIVAAALAAHGIFDLVHPHLLAESGAPAWWPGFCLGVDVVLAAILAALIMTGRINARDT